MLDSFSDIDLVYGAHENLIRLMTEAKKHLDRSQWLELNRYVAAAVYCHEPDYVNIFLAVTNFLDESIKSFCVADNGAEAMYTFEAPANWSVNDNSGDNLNLTEYFDCILNKENKWVIQFQTSYGDWYKEITVFEDLRYKYDVDHLGANEDTELHDPEGIDWYMRNKLNAIKDK